jgi:mRNA-degrading endonuclease RelE of RelBE toxin-antitoxin system
VRLTESFPIEIRLTPDFRKQVRKLEKRYRKIQSDLQPILMQIQMGEVIGDRLQGIDAEVFKVRIRNSDVNRGKSGGYRMIYWLKLPECVVLLDIYSKSDRDDVEINIIQNIINEFVDIEAEIIEEKAAWTN